MILTLCLPVAIAVNCLHATTSVRADDDITDDANATSTTSRTAKYLHMLYNSYLRDSTGGQHLQQQANETAPQFLPTGFHDFVQSNQGPSYSYEPPPSNVPLYYPHRQHHQVFYHPYVAHKEGWNNMYGFYTSPYSYPPAASQTQNRWLLQDRYRTGTPFTDVNGYKFPVPEDRLPPAETGRSHASDGDSKSQWTDARAGRKARFIKSFLENKAKNLFVRQDSDFAGNFFGPPPQDDASANFMNLMMQQQQNTVDRSDPWMMMAMDDGSGGQQPGSGLASFLSDPLAILVVVLLPLSMIVMACLPLLFGMMLNGNANVPLVTTTATGNNNNGKTWDGNSSEFLSPIMDAIGTFSPRGGGGGDCAMRAFCRRLKTDEPRSTTLQKAIFDAAAYVDSGWMEFLGLKTLIKSLKDGNCESIQCTSAPVRLKDPEKPVSKLLDKNQSEG